jgi:hypothetical protein
MKLVRSLFAAFAVAVPVSAGFAATQHSLDISHITAVRITGAASHIALSTTRGNYQASIGTRHTGWFSWWYSSWFFNDCSTTSRMWLNGMTLRIQVTPQSPSSNCTVEIQAWLPAGIDVSITQSAADVQMHGHYASIRVRGEAANFSLTGDVAELVLHGRALHARLRYTRVRHDESLRIDANSLAADISFPRGTRISYDVRAHSALVDSALSNTPGAQPAIAITADYVMATIR